MGFWRKTICGLLAAALVSVPGASATAAGVTPEEPDGPTSMVEPEELDLLAEDFMARRELDPAKIAIAYCYSLTDETWYHNPDLYYQGASLYKLPLMMALAYRVYDGRLQQSDQIGGVDLSEIQERSLVESDNEISQMVITDYFGDFRYYKLVLAEIAGITADKLPPEYFTGNIYNARFMMGVLHELFYHEEKYPNILPNLLQANPGEFFRRSLDGQYDVAQKWGGGDGNFHTAGIIYTDNPFLLVVMTWDTLNAESVIADLAQLVADYTAGMDRRLAEATEHADRAVREVLTAEAAARQAAREEARRAEEEARLAAERALQERLEAEEAARQAQRKAAEREVRRASLIRQLWIGGAAVAVLMTAAALIGRRRKRSFRRKKRKKEE